MSSTSVDNPTELNPADLIQCIGQSFNEQKAFSVIQFIDAPDTVKEEFLSKIVSKTIKNPEQFLLFGIRVDEIHIGLDSADKIVAIYVRLKNQDLVKKMEKAIGDEYMAMSVLPENVEAPPSKYWWDYKGNCVHLLLLANQRMFITEQLPDDGLITFYNCDPDSYWGVPKNESNEPDKN